MMKIYKRKLHHSYRLLKLRRLCG